MNENAIIQNVPAASGLHKVSGFDPLRYLKRTVNAKGEMVLRMELGYQKLWFRLACPNGRLLLNPLRITDQMALIEASVFFDRADSTPAGSSTAECPTAPARSATCVCAAATFRHLALQAACAGGYRKTSTSH